jgi:chromosomal replication initiator protein
MDGTPEAACAKAEEIQNVMATLQNRVGPRKFNAWFKNGTVLSIRDGHVRVTVPNSFVANWVETHYQADIAAAAQEHTGRNWPVVVTIDPALSGKIRRRQLDIQADIVARAGDGRARFVPVPQTQPLRHKLEDFVVGESNKLAYSAALAVAGGKAPFNPLFVHGPCGVGKTHLLQGICVSLSAVRRNGRPLAWRYVSGEQFTNEFISAVRQKKYTEFRDRYRKLNLLAIDDVHFLAAKEGTQGEFLHTYNAIESAGNQIVMASDAHPHLVGDLKEQLVSRFMAGMVVKIDPPDQVTRVAILRRRARMMKLHAPHDVLEYIAMHIRGSVRELEGSLIKLAALSALENGRVTLELATEAMADHLARTDSALTLGDIEAAAGTFFGITPADIHSTRRTMTVSAARMVAMFLARRHTRMSYPEIGKFMGKNHSSAVLAVQRMEKLIADGGRLEWMTPAGPKSMPASKVLELLTEQFR